MSQEQNRNIEEFNRYAEDNQVKKSDIDFNVVSKLLLRLL